MADHPGVASSGVAPLLTVNDLAVSYRVGHRKVPALKNVSLAVFPGEVIAIVGESGSGKSTLANAIISMLPANAMVQSGSVTFGGLPISKFSNRLMRKIRGRRIGVVPQDPMTSLNPTQRIEPQVAEPLLLHRLADRSTVKEKVHELLMQSGLPDLERTARSYPHELSGGMKQRVLIAIAFACGPDLIIADEPTSALDVTVAKHVMDHFSRQVAERRTTLVIITHDLTLALHRADRIIVMRNGTIVETNSAQALQRNPQSDYTRELLANAPRLLVPRQRPHPVIEVGRAEPDPAAPVLLEVKNLTKRFALPPHELVAVDDVSFTIEQGKTLALVGESGSGKSTTARLVLRLEGKSAGSIRFRDTEIGELRGEDLRQMRRNMQVVYQSPYDSLDPRMHISQIVAEPLRAFKVGTRRERDARAAALLDLVGLPRGFLARKPAELSGTPARAAGGDLQSAITQDSGCKDPWQTDLRTQLEYQRQIVDSLLYEGRNGVFTPWLAASWAVNDDATQFTFHLRPGVTFTDGSVFDSATVKANLDAMKAMGGAAPVPASYLSSYIGTDIVDPQTVLVKFSKPNAPFLFGVSTPNFGMYSTRTATFDTAARCAGKGVTSGPFTVDAYVANEKIHMVRNAAYRWGPDALSNKGPAYLDAVTYNIVTNSTAAADALINGRLQMAQGIADQSLDQVTKAGIKQLGQAPAGSSWSFIINLKKGNISDLAVRQAMMVALDRSTLMLAQPQSITSAARGILAPTHPFFTDQSKEMAFDPDKAKAILDKAGWKVGTDGIRVKTGKRLKVDVISYQNSVSTSSMMELVKQELADVGIDLTLTPVTANEERQRRTEGNFETRLSKFTGADPIILAQLVAGFDPMVDELLAEQGSTTDPAKRKAVVAKLSDYIMQQAYLIPIYDQNPSIWWRPDLTNMIFDIGDLSMLAQVTLPK